MFLTSIATLTESYELLRVQFIPCGYKSQFIYIILLQFHHLAKLKIFELINLCILRV